MRFQFISRKLRLAGGIAHDFNNILVPIIGFTEMSIDEIIENEDVNNNLDEVLLAAKRAKELVKQILAFSRQNEKELAPLHIQPVIKEILKLLRASIPSTVEIKHHIENKDTTIMADPTQVHQLIMNLCTNAYQAMLEKGGILTVSLSEVEIDTHDYISESGLKPRRYANITVSDTGHGMDKKTMEKIFDPYFTTKQVGEGTGLGLAVVYGIVKDYRGDITVSSEPGKGTTFNVYLPVIGTGEEGFEDVSFQPLPRGNEHILIIDDEKQVLQITEMMLESLGYTITAFSDSEDALDEFKMHPEKYDFVLTDLMMPKMNGIDLSQEILRIQSDFPIIICTGFGDVKYQKLAQSIGISAYLMKPTLRKELAVKIRQVLDNKKDNK